MFQLIFIYWPRVLICKGFRLSENAVRKKVASYIWEIKEDNLFLCHQGSGRRVAFDSLARPKLLTVRAVQAYGAARRRERM